MASPSSATEKEVQPSVGGDTMKKRSIFDIIRDALFSSSNEDNNPSEKNAAKATVEEKPSIWAILICGIRPLHHPQFDDDEEVVMPPARPMPLPLKLHSFHDTHPLPPPSPGYMSVDEGMNSRYASSEDLHALDGTGKVEAEEGCENKDDSAIDVKAEEFIVKFYEQMRLQRVDSVDLS